MLLQTGADPNGAPQQNQVLPISASASSDFGASHHDSAACWIIASEEILPNNFHRAFAMRIDKRWRPEAFRCPC
jgi:hypothetical protein